MNEMSNVDVELILVDPNEALCREWQMAFAKRPGVSVVCGRFEALPEFDCMVSAANSFGLMDGGVDLAITRFFGVPLMERVQAHILQEYWASSRSEHRSLSKRVIRSTRLLRILRRCACQWRFRPPTMCTRRCGRCSLPYVDTTCRRPRESEEWHARVSGLQRVVSHPTKLLGKWRSLITGICIL